MINLLKYISIIFLVSSCGGGSSSSGISDNSTPDPIANSYQEQCTSTSWNSALLRCDLTHNNLERYYFLYKPASLNTTNNVPVLFALHGYGSSARNHFSYTNYEDIADENNFIIVYPQGSPMKTYLASSSSHWNVGGWTIGSTVDDVSFINNIIDLIILKLPIDQNRIYSSGMSNGGYMSYLLSCQEDSRIAAIASVTGSMTPETFASCNPNHPTAVMQIHGSFDNTVPYNGLSWSKSIPDIISYWSEFNSCSAEPNIVISDYFNSGYSITTESYKDCLNDIDVRLILHSTMGHTWPTLNSHNINASEEIWNFVSLFDIDGLIK